LHRTDLQERENLCRATQYIKELDLGPSPPKTTGGPRILAQVLEQIHLCSARREAQQAGVVAFLKNY